MVKFLAAKGAKIAVPGYKRRQKQTTLEIDAQNGFNEIIEILKKHTNKTPDVLRF